LDEDEFNTVKEEAQFRFKDNLRGFISAKKSISGDKHWREAFQSMVMELYKFMNDRPVKVLLPCL
jgi:hypothetical protein